MAEIVFVLLLVFSAPNGMAAATVEFRTLSGCEAAADAVRDRVREPNAGVLAICLERK